MRVFSYAATYFKTKDDARYAAFFDACHIKWEYREHTYPIGLGINYTPSFLLYNIRCIHAYETVCPILCVEINTAVQPSDVLKMWSLSRFLPMYLIDRPLMIDDYTPDGEDYNFDIENRDIDMSSYNLQKVDGDYFGAWPGLAADGSGFALFGSDYTYLSQMSIKLMTRAYESAYNSDIVIEDISDEVYKEAFMARQ